jgi:hypothetical protein
LFKLRKTWKVLFVAALLSSCTVRIPDNEVCSGTEGFAGVAALCRQTNSDSKRRLNTDQWLDFLYAREDDPNTKADESKGPAICISSEDYRKNETAIAQLCVKTNCTYEVKKQIAEISGRVEALRKEASKGKK